MVIAAVSADSPFVLQTESNPVHFGRSVLPAGAADVGRGSPAEAGAAAFPGSAGSLHRSDPHLRITLRMFTQEIMYV